MSEHSGVGMPAALWLEQFGSYVWDAFDATPYLVGSVLRAMRGDKTEWRDVDVRVILDDERYAAEGYGKPSDAHRNAKWVATCLAWSAFGQRLTGLPIDFQVQQSSDANDNPVNRGFAHLCFGCLEGFHGATCPRCTAPQPFCDYEFDSTACVGAAGHTGAHITSNEHFPYGRPKPPSGPPDAAALKGNALVLLGHALTAAIMSHDAKPGDTVEFVLVPVIWEAYERARAALGETTP